MLIAEAKLTADHQGWESAAVLMNAQADAQRG